MHHAPSSSPRPRTTRAARLLAPALAAATALLASVAPAEAATYQVTACDAAPGSVNRSWAASRTASASFTSQNCPSQALDYSGLAAYMGSSGANAGNGQGARWTFTAPGGTSIVALDDKGLWRSYGGGWQAGVQADSTRVLGCWSGSACTHQDNNAVATHYVIARASTLTSFINCASGTCAPSAISGHNQAAAALWSAKVTIEDNVLPVIVNPRGTLWNNTNWLRGTQTLGFAAGDSSGVSYAVANIDSWTPSSKTVINHSYTCDYAKAQPCGISNDDASFNTAQLTDGPHSVTLYANDATNSNLASSTGTFKADNHAPEAVTGLSVAGGQGWRAINGYDVSWTNPTGQAAPVIAAHYEFCNADGNNCTGDTRAAGNDITSLSNVQAPRVGDQTLRVWLEDAAGNQDTGNAVSLIHLRYDPTVPAQAKPEQRNGWLNKDELAVPEKVNLTDGAAVPPSGIKGFIVTTDGSEPSTDPAAMNAPGLPGEYDVSGLTEGVHTLKARAVSGANVASNYVGSTDLRVDLHAPIVDVQGAPDPGKWQRTAVRLTIHGTDQPGLSGMAPAPAGHGVTEGGFMEYRVDNGAEHQVPGDTAQIDVGNDGDHVVTVQGVDVAGNVSTARQVRVRVDQSSPEVVAFEAQDAADPTKVSVAVSDRLSGIADGVIQVRRTGTISWSSLPTNVVNSRLVAHLNDNTADGSYELQAIARDIAGNETTGDRNVSGQREVLNLPLRILTRIKVGTGRSTTKKCKTTYKRKTRRVHGRKRSRLVKRRVCRRVVVPAVVGKPILVPFGKSVALTGTLLTQGGSRVPGAQLTVVDLVAGQRANPVGVVTSTKTGAFSYRAPKGAGRSVQFVFAGTSVLKGTQGAVVLKVPASATLKIAQRRVHPGAKLRLFGRVLGGYLPRGGKLVELQVLFNGKWSTFTTLHTTRKGTYKTTYQLSRAPGGRTYKMRAKVGPEPTYPFGLAYTKAITVVVK